MENRWSRSAAPPVDLDDIRLGRVKISDAEFVEVHRYGLRRVLSVLERPGRRPLDTLVRMSQVLRMMLNHPLLSPEQRWGKKNPRLAWDREDDQS